MNTTKEDVPKIERIVEEFFRLQNSIWENPIKIELAKRQEKELLRTTLHTLQAELMKRVEGKAYIPWDDHNDCEGVLAVVKLDDTKAIITSVFE